MTRTYDPDLDNVYVNQDGTIRWDGEEIGNVQKTDDPPHPSWKWRAEIGDPANPTKWPRFRASHAKTRGAAVEDVLDGLEVPA